MWVLTDEIYEHLVYGSAVHYSMPAVVPELAEQCVVVNGVAKTYAMTGWRVGWMIGPADVIEAATNLQSHSTSNVCNVAQRAALAAVSGDLSAVAMMREAFDRRRRTITAMLNEIPGVSCIEPEGAFYAFPSFEGLLGRSIAGRQAGSTLELAEIILDEARVAIVPGEAFGAPGYARLSYALSDEDLVEGITRIGKLLSTAGKPPKALAAPGGHSRGWPHGPHPGDRGDRRERAGRPSRRRPRGGRSSAPTEVLAAIPGAAAPHRPLRHQGHAPRCSGRQRPR